MTESVALLPGRLLQRAVRVLVVGCGGNGSAILGGLPYLHQAMLIGGHPGGLEVTAMDGDVVSPVNSVRQPFCRSEIGLSKAIVMISRLNLFWGLHWKAVPEFLTPESKIGTFDLVIGCVDTRAARGVIGRLVEGKRSEVSFWLDLGNSASSGQFVLGQPWNSVNGRSAGRLRTAAELWPELVDAGLDGDDDGPSCSAVESLERQEIFMNQALSQHALCLLARLFRHGTLDHQGAFVDIARSHVVPIPIKSERIRGARSGRGQRAASRNHGRKRD